MDFKSASVRDTVAQRLLGFHSVYLPAICAGCGRAIIAKSPLGGARISIAWTGIAPLIGVQPAPVVTADWKAPASVDAS